jgi:hypothetical protein
MKDGQSRPRSLRNSRRSAQLGFASERMLINALERTYFEVRETEWLWVSEFELTCGIADVVGARLNSIRGASPDLSRIQPRWAYILNLLPFRKLISLSDFVAISGVSPSHAKRILGCFEDAGFVTVSEDGAHWEKTRPTRSLVPEFTAIEAKLSDWRRALYQAVQYQDFATRSWVVLCAESAEEAIANADSFERRGIGLGALDRLGGVDVVCAPQRRVPRVPSRFWEANAEFAKRTLRRRKELRSL